eukprot:c17203_g1_i1.p1 GENE.c17203_g1_i1~~c17203_g1_i1.p1  ORF type:complete len:267 (-),score=65.61 c17203_g1_i1:32-793(-)
METRTETNKAEPVVANIGGVGITANQAITLVSLFSANNNNPNENENQNLTGTKQDISTSLINQTKNSVAVILKFLTQSMALEARPWSQFLNVTKFRKPSENYSVILKETGYNLKYWLYNYAVLSLAIFIYSLLTSPLLILCFLFSGGLWVWLVFVRKQPIVLMGRTLSQTQLLYLLGSFSMLVFLLTSGYKTLMWSLIFSSILSVTHAVFRAPEYSTISGKDQDGIELEANSSFTNQSFEDGYGKTSMATVAI